MELASPPQPVRCAAVLIDADNASASHAAAVFEEIARFAEANVRRIYGDFSGARLRAWRERLQPLAIVPTQQFNHTTGKNAADIALVIDAMDLMHRGMIDTFCLVSSDSDFTRLAQRLRENGKTVIGFGERKTPEAFRNACNRFIYFDNLGNDAESEADPAQHPVKQPPARAASLILKAMAEQDDDEGWAALGVVGQRLRSIAPDFDPRTYGCGKLSDVIRKAGRFELDGSDPRNLRLRRKRTRRRQNDR